MQHRAWQCYVGRDVWHLLMFFGLKTPDSMGTSPESRSSCWATPAWSIICHRGNLAHDDGYSLSQLILTCSDCSSQCCDTRDKIYGLWSLSNNKFDIKPDYSKDTFDIYMAFIKFHISLDHSGRFRFADDPHLLRTVQ